MLVVASAGCDRLRPLPSGRDASIVLVTLDTVRADHLGVYGSTSAVTPNLDRLAASGVRFAEAVSPVPLTLPAHASLLSGLLPPRHGLRNNGAGRFPEEPVTLAAHLRTAGYRTAAFVGAFVLDHRFGLARGFDVYDDEIDAAARARASLDAERPATVVIERAVRWLDTQREGPIFCWVHLYDAHAPYLAPEPFRSRFRDRPYDGEIAALDAALAPLFATVGRRTGRTVIAVVGDHGEALGDHGELTHGLLLYEGSLRVPWLLSAPGLLPRGFVAATPVGIVDLAPTLAGLVARPFPAAARAGRDLSTRLRRRREPGPSDLYAESLYPAFFAWSPLASIRRGDLKYIAAPRPELYDLARDRGELVNLATSRAGDVRTLAAILSSLATAGNEAPAAEVDAEARAKLESLGYIGGSGPVDPHASGKDPKDMVALFRAFEEAHWALNDGRIAAARETLEGLLAADPANPVFLGQLAETSRRVGDLARAVDLYRRAVALSPGDNETRYNLAVTLQEAGRHDEAIAALAEAIARDPGRPEAHNALGIALSLKGDLAGAREQFARATEIDPRDARAFNNLGNVLRDLGRGEEARTAYLQAAEIAPDYADPFNGLGTLEVQGDRPDQALKHFRRALALNPGLHEVRFNLAVAEELAGNRAAAAAAYEDFLSQASGDPNFAAQCRVARQLLARLRGAAASS
jgi:arylsulfatase A-like enzyme/Flp pilus assembly protein TadD